MGLDIQLLQLCFGIWRVEKSAAAMDIRDVLQHEMLWLCMTQSGELQQCFQILEMENESVATYLIGIYMQLLQQCIWIWKMENKSIATDMEEDVLYRLGVATG